MSAAANTPAPSQVAADPAAPKPSRLARKLRPLLIVSLLFLLGAAAGWLWNPSHTDPESPPPEPSPGKKQRPAPARPVGTAFDLKRADDLLRDERFDAALEIYSALKGSSDGDPDGKLQYRIALALEGLGRWDGALAAYQELAGGGRASAAVGAAQVGQARVRLRLGKTAEVKSLLHPLLWRALDEQTFGRPFLADAQYLLALTLAREAASADAPAPFHDVPAPAGAPAWSAMRALAWMTAPAAQKPVQVPAGLAAVHPTGPRHSEMPVNGNVQDVPIDDLIARLADLGSLKVEWSAAARRQVEGRTAALALSNWALLDILHALADAHDLAWESRAGTLRLTTREETPAATLAAYRDASARRALRAVVQQHAGQPLTAAAQLELGNLEARAGDWKVAAACYERLQREAPRSALVTEASYNLGVSYRRLGDHAAARRAFFKVIDRAPAHRLSALAYLRIGQIYLDEGRPREAVAPLRRAVSFGSGTDAQGGMAVFLAAAQLLAADPRGAHDTLLQFREPVGRENCRPIAAFLDALACFRHIPTRKEARMEAGELLAAIMSAVKEDRLGATGKLLLGHAYRELGMSEQMAQVYETARKSAPPEVAAEMSLELAEWWAGGPKRAEAVRVYTAMAEQRQSRWSAPARLRLAALALQENRARDCLQSCRELLAEPQAVERAAVLQVMGRAFERLGEHQQAARCFAGQPPE